jgi:hypothetical protein
MKKKHFIFCFQLLLDSQWCELLAQIHYTEICSESYHAKVSYYIIVSQTICKLIAPRGLEIFIIVSTGVVVLTCTFIHNCSALYQFKGDSHLLWINLLAKYSPCVLLYEFSGATGQKKLS